MEYTALYREWRPRTFEEIVGQAHVVRTLKNAITLGRVAHAYLLCGPRGTGKTSVARLLARAVNCQERAGAEPCGQCSICREIIAGSCMDVLEIDAASNRGIDEIRDLRDKVRYMPARARLKVYIIDEVHMLTPEAFNALLKTLEEPPAHVLFVLATTEPHRLPATILSRCQRFDFHRLTPGEILRRLEKVRDRHGIACDEAALHALARYADGSLRDALSLFDQCLSFSDGGITEAALHDVLGTAPVEALFGLSEAAAGGDAAALLRLVGELHDQGRDLQQLARDWLGHARNLLLALFGAGSALEGFSAGEQERLAEQARRVGKARLEMWLQVLAETENVMRWATQPRILFEVAALRLLAGAPSVPATPPAPALPAPALPAPAAPVAAAPADAERTGVAAPGCGASTPAAPAPSPVAAGGAAAAALPSCAAAATAPETAPAPPPDAPPTPDLAAARGAWPDVIKRASAAYRPISGFLAACRPVAVAPGAVVMAVANPTLRERLEKKHRAILEQAWAEALGFPVRVAFVDGAGAPRAPEEAPLAGAGSPSATAAPAPAVPPAAAPAKAPADKGPAAKSPTAKGPVVKAPARGGAETPMTELQLATLFDGRVIGPDEDIVPIPAPANDQGGGKARGGAKKGERKRNGRPG